jgi:hypothetical protein
MSFGDGDSMFDIRYSISAFASYAFPFGDFNASRTTAAAAAHAAPETMNAGR